MREKINIAELLKDCPQGMELYSPIFGNVYLDKIRPHLAIVVTTDKKQGDFKEEFLYDGRYGMNGECMLFPSKGKTTWEGFTPFNDGDILTYIDNTNKPVIYIYRRNGPCNTSYYVGYSYATNRFYSTPIGSLSGNRVDLRLATKEEKQKLFDTIKTKGYKWNSETKTLEKLIEETKNLEETKFPSFEPMFKINDELEYKIPDGYEITEVSKDKVFIKPIKSKYPTTYEECCDKTNFKGGFKEMLLSDDEYSLYISFIKLKRCRNAYWKIAGEQMGLGKPWEPDWNDLNRKYFISLTCDGISLYDDFRNPQILVFPTAEMRDAFYENFKDLIEKCKELL